MQVKVAIAEQQDGSWETVNCMVDKHDGHPISEEAFMSRKRHKNIDQSDQKLLEDLIAGSADPQNIADVLNQRKDMGSTYDAQFIRNVRSKIHNKKDIKTIEEALNDIIQDGGTVRYKKKDGSDDVNVLTVQTSDMRTHLGTCTPTLFQADTSFGTQSEGYKLYIMVYYSNFTGKWP